MASCYAALVSLQTTIHSILNHPNPPISLDSDQAQALLRNSAFLQNFLEHHSHHEDYPTDELKNKTRDAVFAAEDLIEKCTAIGSSVRCILQRGAECGIPVDSDIDEFWMKKIMEDYNLGISVAIQDMDAIIKDITEMDREKPEDLQLVSSISSLSLASPSAAKKTAMVEFDDVLNTLLDMLIGEPKSSRQIIRITGMGGIGKTTLATQAYQRFSKVKHFDVRVWVTISQNFRERECLQDILGQFYGNKNLENFYVDNEQMRQKIYEHLKGRRYLIILDDVWSIDEELSDMIRSYFPDDANGSRIIVTTRLSSVGEKLFNSSAIQMNLLDDDQSWKLFSETVFKGEVCPFELEEIGKTIAINCGGLPLSIVVVGGFLANSEKTKQYWEYVARELSSIVKSKDNELSGEYANNCLDILYMSYKHLPIHLKPCFLYMGILANGARIRMASLVELLVAEGFLKPISDKCMEVVAQEYIEELADRNLISIDGSRTSRNCRIHDVVRDVCKREAQREKFLYFVEGNDKTESGKCKSREGDDISRERRIVVERKLVKEEFFHRITHLGALNLHKFLEAESVEEAILNLGKELNMEEEGTFLNILNMETEEENSEEWYITLMQYGLDMRALFGNVSEDGTSTSSAMEDFRNLLQSGAPRHEIQSVLSREMFNTAWEILSNLGKYFNTEPTELLKLAEHTNSYRKCLGMLQSASDATSLLSHFEEGKITVQSASDARSLVSHFQGGSFSPPSKSCLLRVIKLTDKYSWTLGTVAGSTIDGDFGKDIIQTYFNCRYVAIGIEHKDSSPPFTIPSSISLLWNLETLILHVSIEVLAPIEVWKMPHLKHLKVSPGVDLPEPLDDDKLVLVKLQTLSRVLRFKCNDQWIKKIPNIKKLQGIMLREDVEHSSCLSNLQRLHEMESLWLHIPNPPVVKQQNITFPQSLRKLTFQTPDYDWQDVTTMIGALPNLEKLILCEIRGTEWVLTRGQFLHLKVLHIVDSYELKCWTADDDQNPFPRIEYLYLESLRDLEEIPSSIGVAPNLQKIVMCDCSDASVSSAEQIQADQQVFEDSELQVVVIRRRMS